MHLMQYHWALLRWRGQEDLLSASLEASKVEVLVAEVLQLCEQSISKVYLKRDY